MGSLWWLRKADCQSFAVHRILFRGLCKRSWVNVDQEIMRCFKWNYSSGWVLTIYAQCLGNEVSQILAVSFKSVVSDEVLSGFRFAQHDVRLLLKQEAYHYPGWLDLCILNLTDYCHLDWRWKFRSCKRNIKFCICSLYRAVVRTHFISILCCVHLYYSSNLT